MSEIVNSFHLAIGLFALWFLYFVCWREHRVDTYRQRLFAMRDDLFDYAASGAIRFDDPAYTTLRDLTNGLIRFGHRLTFTRVWAVALLGNLPQTNRMEHWVVDVNKRSPQVREKLLKAHEEIKRASLWHLLAWSPAAWIFLLVTFMIRVLSLRLTVKAVHVPRDISAVLEQEALEQSSLVEDDSCLAAV
ncbi:MAG: hypothetical protein ACM3WP_01980 [Acidobacteriota bacterium]